VGTAGGANIGKRYAMFEAIHGSAPRMIREGRGQYADPCSMLRAVVLMLQHIGYVKQAEKLEKALDICMYEEKRLTITGRDTGCTCSEFGDYVMKPFKKSNVWSDSYGEIWAGVCDGNPQIAALPQIFG
jgi:isocitrate dehydrogenase (NAD+)